MAKATVTVGLIPHDRAKQLAPNIYELAHAGKKFFEVYARQTKRIDVESLVMDDKIKRGSFGVVYRFKDDLHRRGPVEFLLVKVISIGGEEVPKVRVTDGAFNWNAEFIEPVDL